MFEEPVIVPENIFTRKVVIGKESVNPKVFEIPKLEILAVNVPAPENVCALVVPIKFILEVAVVVSELVTVPLLIIFPPIWSVDWRTSKTAPVATEALPSTIIPPVPKLPTSKVPPFITKFPFMVNNPEVTALNLPVPVLLIVKFPEIVLAVEVKALNVAVDAVIFITKLPKLVELEVKLVPVVFPFKVAVAFACHVAVGM